MSAAVTFVLPGTGRSGGTATTLRMALQLRSLDLRVRIACRVPRRFSLENLRSQGRSLRRRMAGVRHDDWLREQKDITYFCSLGEVSFEPGEVVIAVGSWAIEAVYRLEADVHKMRWCKGFNEHRPEEMQRYWGLSMPTVVVSPLLIPRVERLSGHRVIGVTPNGIDTRRYYAESVPRDGVGAILRAGWKKDPELLLRVLQRLGEELPQVPRYVFGTEPRPSLLPAHHYWRYPAPDQARQLYSRSLVWLIPSRSEGFCNPILEAMACGSVVVSTNHDTAPGLIEDGRNGFLVPIGDVDAFLRKTREILENETLRKQLQQAGFETVARFSWTKAAENMAAAIDQLVRSGGQLEPLDPIGKPLTDPGPAE